MPTPQQPIGSGFDAASTTDDVIAGIDLSGKVAIVTELYDRWEALLLAGVEAMARYDALPPGSSAAGTARGILAAIQGGVMMLQSTGRIGYLESGLDLALAPLHVTTPASV